MKFLSQLLLLLLVFFLFNPSAMITFQSSLVKSKTNSNKAKWNSGKVKTMPMQPAAFSLSLHNLQGGHRACCLPWGFELIFTHLFGSLSLVNVSRFQLPSLPTLFPTTPESTQAPYWPSRHQFLNSSILVTRSTP